jgi:DNA modification methylase
MKLTNIHINPTNPRVISGAKFDKLCKSIEQAPWMMKLRPIVVDDDGMILGGNMRFSALKRLKFEEIPDEWIVRASQLTEEQKREFLIKDNVGYGEWDIDALLKDWDQDLLDEWGLDLPEMEYEEQKEVKEDDFNVPTTIETDIQVGDIITIGPHRLICGDSTILETYSRLLEERTADLVVTDPPYNVDYQGGTGLKIQNDNMSDAAFFRFLLDAMTAMNVHLRAGGAVYVWHADSEGLNFRRAFIEAGLDLKQCLVWVKNSLVLGRQDYQWRHEPCLYGWKPGAAHYFTGDRTNSTVIDDKLDLKKLSKAEMLTMLQDIFSDKVQTSVLYHDKPSRNTEHPTMKPVKLIANLIQNSSKPGQLVLDAFGGSGTTMIAAHQLGRRAALVELDPKYCQVIVDRMRAFEPTIEITRNGQAWTRYQKAS